MLVCAILLISNKHGVPFQTSYFTKNSSQSHSIPIHLSYFGEGEVFPIESLNFKSGVECIGMVIPLSMMEATYRSIQMDNIEHDKFLYLQEEYD